MPHMTHRFATGKKPAVADHIVMTTTDLLHALRTTDFDNAGPKVEMVTHLLFHAAANEIERQEILCDAWREIAVRAFTRESKGLSRDDAWDMAHAEFHKFMESRND